MKLLLFSIFLLLPAFGFSQVADSALAVREVDSLIQVSMTMTDKREFNEALNLNTAAEKIALDRVGRESAAYGTCCFNRGRVFYFKKDYPEAEKWYLESKEIREKTLGKEHSDYAWTLNNLANLYTDTRKYEKAETLYLEAIFIREKALGKEHPDYASGLNNLAIFYKKTGQYKKAETLYLEAKTIREKVLGKEHPDYASSLNNLAVLYVDIGKYEKAETLYLESKAIREKSLGKEHLDYATSLNNLANLYKRMGQYEEAEPLLIESKAIREKTLGKEDSDFAKSLNNLANLYTDIGQYEKAEPLYLESIAIFEKTVGKVHPFYAQSLNNLAGLYKDFGNYEKAEPFLKESNDILEKVLGKSHPDYAQSMDNLASLYKNISQYEKAELLSLEALAIWEKVLGKSHPDYAYCLHNLAGLYKNMGQYEKAELLYLEAKTIWEKSLKKEHPRYAWSLYNLASLYVIMGQYEKAEPLYLESKAIVEKTLGKEHPDYALSLNGLALLYAYMDLYYRAEPIYIEQSVLDRTLLEKASRHLSEQEMGMYLSKFSDRQTLILSCIQRTGSKNVIPACYDNCLFYKGFLLHAAGQLKWLAYTVPAFAEKFNHLKGYYRRLAVQYATPIAKRDSSVTAELEVKVNDLEKNLIRTVAGYGEAIRQVNWQEVQQQLKPGEAAIEFIDYHYYNPKATDSTMYAALLLKPGKEAPRFITLFEERQVAPLIKGASGKAVRKINALYAGKDANTLYDLIWKPLEPFLLGVKTIYASPSGLLHRLNLGDLTWNDGRNIADQYRIATLGSTRRLVLPDTVARAGMEAVLVGGVRYTSDSAAIHSVNSGIAARNWSTDVSFHPDTLTRSGNWTYLPETALEVQDIRNLLQSTKWTATLDTGYFATEEAFRSIGQDKPSPRILHVATHGFFYPDPKENPKAVNRSPSSEPVFKLSEHPMIRSGLLLAGADEAWTTGKTPQNREDGILTAYEISQMNLSNTELVVLSACETGLGEIEGNEGVYGLQRAFKIAGAKYLIMSLWEVSDKTTRELMTYFYRQWLVNKMAIPEAFRAAQSDMRTKYPSAPYLWAGFVLVE